MLDIKEIEMNYGEFKLSVDQLGFKHGLHVILGANGSGKSTLLKGIVGYGGKDLRKHEVYWKDFRTTTTASIISYLPQTNPVFNIRVEDYIELTTREPNKKQKNDLVKYFNIENLMEQSVESLSGGELKRVQCAQVALEKKDIMMFDEMEQGLDLKYQHHILNWMKEAGNQKTVIASMHDAALAMTYADGVILMKDGEVIAGIKSPADITSEMLSECYDIPLDIERINNQTVIFNREL